jgi:hypothetical protein
MKTIGLAGGLLAALSLGSATPAYASNASSGTIQDIWVMWNGTVLFNHSGSRTALPGCQSSSVPKRWAINGESRIAALLTAYSLGKQIFITGSGSCSDWGDTESVTWFAVSDPANGNGTIF